MAKKNSNKKSKNKKYIIVKKNNKRKKDIFRQNYFDFSNHVLKIIFKNKKFFIKLIITIVFMSIILLGIMPQKSYNIFKEVVDQKITNDNFNGIIKKSGTILASLFDTGGFAIGYSQVKNIYLGLILVLTWLAIVKFLRFYLADKQYTFKNILYSCGTPIIGLLINLFILILKMLPMAIIIILYSIISKSIFFESTMNVIILDSISLFLVSINIYWALPSLISLAVITLPKMTPMDSIKFSRDLIHGQRFKIILRLFWHLIYLILFWLIVMIPIISLNNILIAKIAIINKIPFISLIMIIMTISSVVWTFVYFYFIYRRLMENDQTIKKK